MVEQNTSRSAPFLIPFAAALTRLTLLLVVLTSSTPTIAQTPPKPPDGFLWKLNPSLSDEFDGTQLDAQKWHDHNPNWAGRPPGKLVPSAVRVADGFLRIQCSPLVPAEDRFSVACGTIQSKQKALYGYYECRMKASRLSTSSNFWFVGKPVATARGKLGHELIVQFAIGKSKQHNPFMKSNAMVSLQPNEANREREKQKSTDRLKLKTGAADDFHTYGCWWVDANTLRFYVDGQFAYTIHPSKKFGGEPFRYPLSVNLICETLDWQPTPTREELMDPAKNTALFDYVRAFQLVPNEK